MNLTKLFSSIFLKNEESLSDDESKRNWFHDEINNIMAPLGLDFIFPNVKLARDVYPDMIRPFALSDEGLSISTKIVRERVRFLKNLIDTFSFDYKWQDIIDIIAKGEYPKILLNGVLAKILPMLDELDALVPDPSLSVAERQRFYTALNNIEVVIYNISENNEKLGAEYDYARLRFVSTFIVVFSGSKYLRCNQKSRKTHSYIIENYSLSLNDKALIHLRALIDPEWDISTTLVGDIACHAKEIEIKNLLMKPVKPTQDDQ